MSEDKIEIDTATLNKIFSIAGLDIPEKIDASKISDVLDMIERDLTVAKSNSSDVSNSSPDNLVNEYLQGGEEQKRPRTVLIIDDLGVIVYQLELMFKKMGFEVMTSNRVNDCIAKFKKKDYGYVIMDLFLPTEKEGFLLLDELKKLVLLCKLDTKIVVMTASSKNEYKVTCKNRGADYYIEKTQGWQNELLSYCK